MATRPHARTAAPLPAPTPTSVTPPTLIPVTEWPTRHLWPPLGGLRWLKFHAATNGFQSAFLKVGRSVLVDEGEFFACVARVNAAAAKPPKRRSLTLPKPVEVLDAQEVS